MLKYFDDEGILQDRIWTPAKLTLLLCWNYSDKSTHFCKVGVIRLHCNLKFAMSGIPLHSCI